MLGLKKLMDSVFNGAGPEESITAKDREMLGAAERLGRRLDAKVGNGATGQSHLLHVKGLTDGQRRCGCSTPVSLRLKKKVIIRLGDMLVCQTESRNSESSYLLYPCILISYSDYNAEQGIYWVTVKSPIAEVMGELVFLFDGVSLIRLTEKHKTGSIKGDTKDVYLLFEIIWFLLRSQKGDNHVSRERLARQLKKECVQLVILL